MVMVCQNHGDSNKGVGTNSNGNEHMDRVKTMGIINLF